MTKAFANILVVCFAVPMYCTLLGIVQEAPQSQSSKKWVQYLPV